MHPMEKEERILKAIEAYNDALKDPEKQLETQARKSKQLQDKEEKQTAKTAVVTVKVALKVLKCIDPKALL